MTDQILILVRGLPGSGKTSFAHLLDAAIFSADDYFTAEDGTYTFKPQELAQAHAQCIKGAQESVLAGQPITAVANTFSTRWELEPYLQLSDSPLRLKTFIVDLFDGGLTDEQLFKRNSHGVPLDAIRRMRSRWEHPWGAGNPVPPWDRG